MSGLSNAAASTFSACLAKFAPTMRMAIPRQFKFVWVLERVTLGSAIPYPATVRADVQPQSRA